MSAERSSNCVNRGDKQDGDTALQGFAAPQVIHSQSAATRTQKGNRNKLKKRTLEIFELYGSLNPPAWAVLAKFHPIRSAYSYLHRLHRFGLLRRDHDNRGFLVYAISERGRHRLRWLSFPTDPRTSQTSILETTPWHFDPK